MVAGPFAPAAGAIAGIYSFDMSLFDSSDVMFVPWGMPVNIRRTIQRKIRHRSDGINVAADVTAEIAGNVGHSGVTASHTSSHNRVVQGPVRKQSEKEDPNAGTDSHA
jgi:hypothetical protein